MINEVYTLIKLSSLHHMHTPVNSIQININQLQTFVVATEKLQARVFVTNLHATHLFMTFFHKLFTKLASLFC